MENLLGIMKAIKIHHGVSAIFTSVLLAILLMTDILYLADKSQFSVIISMFGSLELLKYFIISLYSPGILETVGTNTPYSSCSALRSSYDRKIRHTMKVIYLIIAMTMLYHISIILLGAGVFDKFEETLLLSVFLSLLTFLPLSLYFGPESGVATLFDVYPAHIHSFEVTLRQSAYITLFGAWVGAFVIPLDWDRPWQKWPIPCAVGAMSGYGISHIIKLLSPQLIKYAV